MHPAHIPSCTWPAAMAARAGRCLFSAPRFGLLLYALWFSGSLPYAIVAAAETPTDPSDAATVPADGGVALDEARTRAILDQFIAAQRKLTRIQATIRTTQEGKGVFAQGRAVTREGELVAELPAYFRFTDKGDPAEPLPRAQWLIWLADGKQLWILNRPDEGVREVERRDFGGGEKGKEADILSFLIGEEVKSAEDVMRHYAVRAARIDREMGPRHGGPGAPAAPALVRLHLTKLSTDPKRDPKLPPDTTELLLRPGAAVPVRVTTVRHRMRGGKTNVFGKSTGAGTVKTERETRELFEVRTNLSTPPLPPIPPETFDFGALYDPKTMKVLDGANVMSESAVRAAAEAAGAKE